MPRKSDYQQKRDFGRTPEPRGRARSRGRGEPRTFVIHRHEATHLHYDLRLRMQGTLKCWAVPRGFSYLPADKRLAMRTEDHPVEYERFSGVIPRGEYGAGTMEIWDHGTYELVNVDGEAGLEGGKLEVRLDGRRLRGEWHLVKTRREEGSWLLFKARDEYARSAEEGPYPFAIDLDAAGERKAPGRPGKPMQPARTVPPFSDPGWLFEAEFAGRRVLATKDGDEVGLFADGRRLAGDWQCLVPELARIHAARARIDGVLVAADASGTPSREALEERLAGRGEASLALYAFDLLHYDDWRLQRLPLIERKTLLAAVLPRSERLLYVDHVVGEGERLAAVVAASGLPGVIAKQADSPYRGGASSAWQRLGIEGVVSSDSPSDGHVLERIAAAAPRRASRVRFTNRDKVFWPQQGHTKGDLIDYYDQMAELLLPYLHDRPLHMYRFPDGVEGKSFYHHDAPDHVPDWVETLTIEGDPPKQKRVRYIICNDRDTLLYLANLGSIDLHPWMSRIGSLDAPDYLVLDLDPDGSPFAQVVRVARAAGKLLRGIGVAAHPKTSGASGLHIVIPVRPLYSYEQVRMFGEMVARYLAREHPDLCTVERSVARRGGRVYVDYLQNHRGQTVVPPYVVRPVAAASVSTPLDWDELSVDLDPTTFTLRTVPDRVARLGDLAHGILGGQQELLPALEAFQARYLDR